MFGKLQKKWGVSGLQLFLILITFAFGGSMTGYISKKIMNWVHIDLDWLWTIVYIVLVTIFWPLSVLAISIFTGQFRFFSRYIKRMGVKLGLVKGDPASRHIHIAIFASGAGSNAQKIIDHFKNSASIKVALIVCNKPGAGVLNIAAHENIPTLLLDKDKFSNGNGYADELKEWGIDFIVLAGFLWKVPVALIKAYPNSIINIHPALLPKYGGKGMYGEKVHKAVIAAGDAESGITIHYVDEIYDHGAVILQEKCMVETADTPATLANRIHSLEHAHYPKVIEKLLTK